MATVNDSLKSHSDEALFAGNPNPFYLADYSAMMKSEDLDPVAPRTKKRLTAIQEIANDAGVAEDFLSQDHQILPSVSFIPEQVRPRSGDATLPVARPKGIAEAPLENHDQNMEDTGQSEPHFHSSLASGVSQPVYLKQNANAMPWSSKRPNAIQRGCEYTRASLEMTIQRSLIFLVTKCKHSTERSDDETKRRILYPVAYGTSSKDEDHSVTDLCSECKYPGVSWSVTTKKSDAFLDADCTPPNPYRANAGNLTNPASEDQLPARAFFPPSSKKPAEDPAHVGDLLHYSPGLSRQPRSLSSFANETASLELTNDTAGSSSTTKEARSSIPDISTKLLDALGEHQKEDYLENAITQAKTNSKQTRVPFLIMRDGRSCVMSVKKDEVEFIDSPEAWKRTMLAESYSRPQELEQSTNFYKTKQLENHAPTRKRLQKLRNLNHLHNTSLGPSPNASQILFNDADDNSSPVMENVPTLIQSGNLAKAHRTLGIIGDAAVVSAAWWSQQPQKPRSSSATDKKSTMTLPPRAIASTSTLNVTNGLSPNKYSGVQPISDKNIEDHAASSSPHKFGVNSPSRQRNTSFSELSSPRESGMESDSRQRNISVSERSSPLNPAKSLGLRRVASFLSDGSRDCPIKASFEDVSAITDMITISADTSSDWTRYDYF